MPKGSKNTIFSLIKCHFLSFLVLILQKSKKHEKIDFFAFSLFTDYGVLRVLGLLPKNGHYWKSLPSYAVDQFFLGSKNTKMFLDARRKIKSLDTKKRHFLT